MSVEKAIWSAFVSSPTSSYSIRELSLTLKKSYPLIHQHMTRLLKEKKFSSSTVGKSILCFPNYKHPYSLLELAHAELLHSQEQAEKDVELQSLLSFFTTKQPSYLLCAWMTNQGITVLLTHESEKKQLVDMLGQTTLSRQITYLTLKECAQDVGCLLKKEVVLCGFAQFHQLIKQHYRQYASYSHMGVLDE